MQWKLGQTEFIELPNNSVDRTIAALSIPYCDNLTNGLKNYLNFKAEWSNRYIYLYSKANESILVKSLFPKMSSNSIVQRPDMNSIKTAIENYKFHELHIEKYFVHPDLEDKFLY